MEEKQKSWFFPDIELLRNKYFIATLLFIIWVAFFDQNSWVERYQNIKELRQLENDKVYYMQKIEEDRERLKELKTNNENLEKFAREQYFMKKDNEDVFLVVEE